MVKEVKLGNNIRNSFSGIKEALEMPNLIEIQMKSYKWFLEEGLKEVFRDVSSITDHTGNLVLDFLDYTIEDTPKYSVTECKERDTTYAAPIKVLARLINKETGEIKEQEVFMGDFPLMTESGTFVINGAERVIVSQLVRSPGIYYDLQYDKTGKKLFSTTVIPNRGAWLEYETNQNDIVFVRIDKNRKLVITALVRALYSIELEEKGESFVEVSDEMILDLFGNDERIKATLEVDTAKKVAEAFLEVYKKLRPGEPATVDGAKSLIKTMFYEPKRYDLSKVGRYKYNKKLNLEHRISGKMLSRPAANPITGEIIAEAGKVISKDTAGEIARSGLADVFVKVDDREVKVFSNGMVDIGDFVGFETRSLGVNERVRFSVLQKILKENKTEAEIKSAIAKEIDNLIPKNIIFDDIVSSINYLCCLSDDIGNNDDIDHLGNRRLRCVGELLQNQFRIGFARMERVIRERMTIQDLDIITPQALINIRPVVAAIKEFFGSSPLSQFMDQTNPLAELTHKRRLSALGPGGLSRDRAGFEVRDVHYSHYGRMCPIETPEGPNIGLISYLSTFARVNDFGFIEAPYRKIDKKTNTITDEIVYMTADAEDGFIIAQASEELDKHNKFAKDKIVARFKDEILEVESSHVDYMDVSPKMLVSVATSMIPFLENDDANRALMGANMQRQAVPLLKSESPIVGTGMEYKAGVDSGVAVIAVDSGYVTNVSSTKVIINEDSGNIRQYDIIKFLRSNQGTCINQKPIVEKGQRIEKGDVIADGPSTDHGEISLGKNALIGFMTWEGYNYEDAILINERLVKEDIYTSIHIEEYELEARDTKLGPEEITRDIPNVGEDAVKDLDSSGIIRIGAEVRSGDILAGKVTPKGETELTAEERLLRAIFGEKAREVRDTSLRVPHGESGTIVDVKVFTRENGDEMSPGVNMVVRCYVAQKRKISVGDKMAGRHGNKGVVSRILPQEDMPFLDDGTPLDIVLNPLGVPSRMNIGQVLEVHLGYAAKLLGLKIMTPVFDGANEADIEEWLKKAGVNINGKSILRDGRTGEAFDNPVTVGIMYFLKLHHLVDDKIHARSTGPYSLVTQQPLGGKAQFGGQRFGEMEVWALEAYGSAYTLQEILTVKSDDVVGRVKTYESIVKGHNVPKPGVPESFKVLIKELQSLALDVRVLDKDLSEIELREGAEDDDMGMNLVAPPDIGESVLIEDELDGSIVDDFEEDLDEVLDDVLGLDDDEFEEEADGEDVE